MLAFALVLMLRVTWTDSPPIGKNSDMDGVVVGSLAIANVPHFLVRTDDGKIHQVVVDYIYSSKWAEVKQ
jgi:hypothetical protein